MTGIMGYLPIFMIFPITQLLARQWGLCPLVWILVACQLLFVVMAEMGYGKTRLVTNVPCQVNIAASGCIFMFITASSPNRRSLGATNGLAQTTVSIARAIGPAISTSFFAFSSEHNLLGGYAVYVVLFALSCTSLLFAKHLPEDASIEGEEEDE